MSLPSRVAKKQTVGNSPFAGDEVVSFTVKLPKSLKNLFIETATAQEDNASKLVRRWIKEYVQQHSPDQRTIF